MEVIKKFTAEFEIKFTAEFIDSFSYVLRLNRNIFVVVKPYFVHDVSPM